MVTVLTCALIAEDVYHDRPSVVEGFRPVRVKEAEAYCADGDFAAGAYAGRDGIGVIGLRGTREVEDWTGANLQIIRRRMPEQRFGMALAYFAAAHRALALRGCGRFLVVGHSLGGGLAAVVAGLVTWVPVRGLTFNAPGLAEFAAAQPGADRGFLNAANVFNFRSAADVVSCWGTHIGHVYEISDAGLHGIGALIRQLSCVQYGAWEV